MEAADFVKETEAVIRECAREPLADGRATLTRRDHDGPEGWCWFELTPANERACTVSVTPNGPGDGELTIGVGRNDAWFEAWGSADESLAKLRDTLDAALAGRYEEFYRGSKHVGCLTLSDGPFRFSGNTFARFPPRFGRWKHATYEPY